MERLPLLPGTAPDGTWRMGNADGAEADGRLATFAILTRRTPTSLSLLGTGFYLQLKGGFATAAHVALEAERLLSESPDSVGISHTLPDGRTVFRPIWRFFIHPTADVAFGIPKYDMINDRTGEAYRPKVLSVTSTSPNLGAAISTWSYPLHRVVGDVAEGQFLQLQPEFYNGTLQELFTDRGPSVKLVPPYYRTNIHLHGGSSGGPVFNIGGEVFGIASCSYDGAEDIAFVTPAGALLDIQVPERIGAGGDEGRTLTLRDVAELGQMSAR
jgi:Trypsin-like peptidase domain